MSKAFSICTRPNQFRAVGELANALRYRIFRGELLNQALRLDFPDMAARMRALPGWLEQFYHDVHDLAATIEERSGKETGK